MLNGAVPLTYKELLYIITYITFNTYLNGTVPYKKLVYMKHNYYNFYSHRN